MNDIIGYIISYCKLVDCSSISPFLSISSYGLIPQMCIIKFLVMIILVSMLKRCNLPFCMIFRRTSWFKLSRAAILERRSDYWLDSVRVQKPVSKVSRAPFV